MLPKMYPFQSSIETIRAHHWRSFTDVYVGCSFDCQYCLYRGPSDFGSHVRPSALSDKVYVASSGILDIGAASDPYQPVEAQERRTRNLLKCLLDTGIPTFVLTRGPLILRDIDLLAEMAVLGIVEVCFSLITMNSDVTRALEPGAPPPEARLEAAARLAAAGIPVSFHLAPLIPGLDSDAGLRKLAKSMFETGASHLFTAQLGARPAFWSQFVELMSSVRHLVHDWDGFVSAYGPDLLVAQGPATTCDVVHAERSLLPIRDVSMEYGRPFISENYVAFTTAPLTGGIYRWKLPTVYDMAAWIRSQARSIGWEEFYSVYYQNFAPSAELAGIVYSLWKAGSLFLGALVRPVISGSNVLYESSDVPQAFPRTTLVTRKGLSS
jgi:DNA repair photolyase